MNRSIIKPFTWVSSVILSIACVAHVCGQFRDFLGRAIEVKLTRKRPPEYYVIGTAIKLQVGSQIPSGKDSIGLLRARLESGLFAQDSRLKSDEAHAETLIICEITRLDANDGTLEKRTTRESQKTGQVYDSKKGKMVDKFEIVPVTRNYKIVKGGINISYQAKDYKTKQILDAQNIQPSFAKEYLDGNGAPSAHEVSEALINLAVEQLVKRLTPTTETLTVLLPRGKVEEYSKNLGQRGLWEKMREGVDKMGVLPKSSDEAYRQFGLGIANEALAYQAEKIEDSIKLFGEASVNYDKALELKKDEKYFSDPIARIQESLAQYKKLASQRAAYEQAKLVSKQVSQQQDMGSKKIQIKEEIKQPSQPPIEPKRPAALTNQKVIEMATADLDEASIIAAINSATAVQFNLSPDGLIDLRKNKISNNVIGVMRLKQSKQATAPRRAATQTRKKN